MKKMRSILALILLLGVLLALAIPALAEETEIDWANYDWENFRWGDLNSAQENSLHAWLRTEAPIERLFFLKDRSDGYYSEDMASDLGLRFREDPQGLIRALAKEPRKTQDNVIHAIVYNGGYDPSEFEAFMSQLVLDEDATTAEKSILVRMVQCAEENYNMSITNPHTGDPVGVVVALLAVSGAGLAVMLPKKKKIA